MSHIVTGDAFDVLADMDAESVHAVVTDPPYGLAFMGRDWDTFDPKEYQEWCGEWAALALDVLKPGGHLLAFSGNRTHHRLFSGVEDAGFEIRDTLTWHYGSGFPKALDVSKAIDKQKDKTPIHEFRNELEEYREQSGWTRTEIADEFGVDSRLVYMWMGDGNDPQATSPTEEQWEKLRELLGAQELDDRWNDIRGRVGKPSVDFERREVIGEGDAGLANGHSRETGAHEVGYSGEYEITAPATDDAKEWDGWKTALKPATEFIVLARKPFDGTVAENVKAHGTGALNIGNSEIQPNGRYPANVVFDESANPPNRYFYTSKATRAERTLNGKIDNAHPTVKPVDLMEWLVRLISAEAQTVLDPFAGTGTTCRAAKDLGRDFIGIEKQAKWADVARVRCGLTPDDPANVRNGDGQGGLEQFAE